MRRALRIGLTWLLALALPMQGVAAATMAACGSRHGSASAASAAMPADDAGGIARHAHRHGAAIAQADDVVAPATHDTTRAKAATGHGCSACASCCLNAIVPTATVSFDTLDLPDHFAPFVRVAAPPYVTDGLERPPRPRLA